MCDYARPRNLGLNSLGYVHAMLGDIFLDQLEEFWTTHDLIRNSSNRGAGGMGGAGAF